VNDVSWTLKQEVSLLYHRRIKAEIKIDETAELETVAGDSGGAASLAPLATNANGICLISGTPSLKKAHFLKTGRSPSSSR